MLIWFTAPRNRLAAANVLKEPACFRKLDAAAVLLCKPDFVEEYCIATAEKTGGLAGVEILRRQLVLNLGQLQFLDNGGPERVVTKEGLEYVT